MPGRSRSPKQGVRRGGSRRAQDVDVIDAMSQAEADGFLSGILVGDMPMIGRWRPRTRSRSTSLRSSTRKNVNEAAHYAVKLASDGKADAIMKGFLPTSALLKVVLDKQYNLRGKNTLSHCAVLDIPGYHKLLNFTDGGMVVKPDLEQKFQILENAVLVGRALGLVAGEGRALGSRRQALGTDAAHAV